jgi:hypothetical protein
MPLVARGRKRPTAHERHCIGCHSSGDQSSYLGRHWGIVQFSKKNLLALALAIAAISDAGSACSCNFEVGVSRERGCADLKRSRHGG